MAASRRRRRPLADVLAATVLLAAALCGCASSKPRPVKQPAPAPAPPASTGTGGVQGVPGGGPPAPGPVRDLWRQTTTVRVGLKARSQQLLVSGSREWDLTLTNGDRVASASSGTPLRVVRVDQGTVEVYRQGELNPLWSGGLADTLVLIPSGKGFSGFAGKWYRGLFRIFASSPSGLTIVNELDIEEYLRGVLPEEIGTPPPSDFEAVKAQAVAARSYTLSYLGRRSDLGFDLWATIEDQVYGGTSRENGQSNRALDLTRGEVLLSDGAPIRALYSSACGGRTANVEDVWPWPWMPYLRSVRDAESPQVDSYCTLSSNYRWREEWDAAAFLAMVRKFGPQAAGAAATLSGKLLDVRIVKRGRSGRVRDLAITTTEGDLRLHGDRTRWGLRRPGGEAILRSAFFKIGVVRASDGSPLHVVATGGGNGHGIGMCQWGAMGMARAGKDYKEILAHYYKNTTLTRL